MNTFELTRKAVSDLKDIARYIIKRWGRLQRNHYLKQLDDTFHRLAESPMTGKPCDNIRPGYRKFPQGSHIVFYRQIGLTHIQVVRILHKSMDVEQHLTTDLDSKCQ
ncbi:type II toxin-antitoxin system RelE/ParE family toxin [Endozoicomonas atrinae]|uniref:type II toxin-antitoxin system RelE/ParE family toxin n=1 Tax=Endozoicomonas atrinae TaxID=1333660 RepID=UPI000825E5AB|nr:type II toxin-antitoxin system RelE/ParE family toxin [Endozoicomonas atrinae]